MDIRVIDISQALQSGVQPKITLPTKDYRGWTVAAGPLPTNEQETLVSTRFTPDSTHVVVPLFPMQVPGQSRIAVFAGAVALLVQAIPKLVSRPGILFIGHYDDQAPNLRVWIGVIFDER